MRDFSELLDWGQEGEEIVARYWMTEGYSILFSRARNNGPQRFYTPRGGQVAPDLLVFNSKHAFWCECKRKDRFELYRKKRFWYTGIDTHMYTRYAQLMCTTPFPLCFAWIHETDDAYAGLAVVGFESMQHNIKDTWPASAYGKGLVMWDRDFIAQHTRATIEDLHRIAADTQRVQPFDSSRLTLVG